MKNNYTENVEVTVNDIIWGNTKMDILNGYDNIAYTTLKLKCDYYTIMVFKNNFNNFKNIKVGDTFKAVIKLWQNDIYNFVSLIKDHPKLASAKKEFEIGNFTGSILHFNEYFKTCDLSQINKLPLGIYTDYSIYNDALVRHFKLNISETNPLYEQFQQNFEKCYEQSEKDDYGYKDDGSIKLHFYFNTLGFGKYKEEKITDVLNKDPEYLLSLIIETNSFCIEDICFIFNDFTKVPNFAVAYEINCVKLLISEEHDECHKSAFDHFSKPHEDFGGFDSSEECAFKQVFEGDDEAWNSHYQ